MAEEEDRSQEKAKEDEEEDEDAGGDDAGSGGKGKRPPDSIMVQRKSARGGSSAPGSAGRSQGEQGKSVVSMLLTIGGLVAFVGVVLGVIGFIVYKVTQSGETDPPASTTGSSEENSTSLESFARVAEMIPLFDKIPPKRVRDMARVVARDYVVFAEAPDNEETPHHVQRHNSSGGSNSRLHGLEIL